MQRIHLKPFAAVGQPTGSPVFAAPLQPLAPLDPIRALIASVLREAVMLDSRTFDLIRKPADGSKGWRTVPYQCFEPEAVADLVMDPALIVGLRHRDQTRLLAVDLDNHGQQNWRPDNPGLIALQTAAEAVGIVPVLISTPNGLHLWLAIPEAVPVVRAHWVVRELLQRAQVDSVEVFPSLGTGSAIADAKNRPMSNGIRLPGQAGSALWVGDRWIDDPLLIWQELETALELAEACPAWQELQEAAAALKRQHKRPCRRFPSRLCASRPPGGAPIEWTGTGQSNDLLGRLANRGYRDGHRDREALAAYIEAAALAAPGFDRWASTDTKRHLASKARDWSKSCIARPPLASAGRPRSTDPNHNDREHARCVAKVAAAAAWFGRRLGDKAMGWSERKAHKAIGISRQTFRKLKPLWRVRLLAACYASRSVAGTHPYSKGGDPTAVVLGSSIHQSIPGPASPGRCLSDRHCRPPSTADPPPMPTMPNKIASHPWLADRRSREREELARWLGAAA
jgi:hypothetical protein